MSKLYVGNLDRQAEERDLQDFFRDFKFKSMWIARKPAGFAFVEFDEAAEAEDAAKALDGREMMGRTIKVEIAKNRGGGDRGGDRGRGRGGSRGGGRDFDRRRSPPRYGQRDGSPRRRSRSRSPRRDNRDRFNRRDEEAPRRSRSPPPRRDEDAPPRRERSRSRS